MFTKEQLLNIKHLCDSIKAKDERLSPMTYKKLKELGYSSDDWKNWSQEEANKKIHGNEKKGEKKNAKKEAKKEESSSTNELSGDFSMQIDEAESQDDLDDVEYAIETAYEDGDIDDDEYDDLMYDLDDKRHSLDEESSEESHVKLDEDKKEQFANDIFAHNVTEGFSAKEIVDMIKNKDMSLFDKVARHGHTELFEDEDEASKYCNEHKDELFKLVKEQFENEAERAFDDEELEEIGYYDDDLWNDSVKDSVKDSKHFTKNELTNIHKLCDSFKSK